MLFVEQRSDDGVQTNRLTLTSGTSHEQVRHFGQVHHKHLVGNSLSERDGQFESRVLKLFGVDDALHRHDARIFVRHLNTNGALARNRCNDTYAKCRE